VLVPSPRQCSYLELVHRFHPQAILYLQGKATGLPASAQSATIPIWFLGEKGAVTLALSHDRLVLSSYLGDRMTLRSRSR
jgi:hypothetical protein